ncbi:MAG: biotin synthase BioB [Muribaculaceae bacterium]|nr:biotin synthase BioB [Muribaculaceae bacterium]
MQHNEIINSFKNKILSGSNISEAEAYQLADMLPDAREQLREASAEITATLCSREFDSCSIVNARSGLCSENCKWCAQSKHHATNCETYDLINHDECMEAARDNHRKGVRRFSLVASGRAVKGKALDSMCSLLREAKEDTGISTCASLGLLEREDLQQLWDAGVRRYHCNLETAPSHFPTLCTTHTIEDKIKTIRAAKDIGFEICSGGIIGMGETTRQRVEFALKLREVAPNSIPLNILSPIPGTPLENQQPISDDDILDTVALFRFINPRTQLRFAGGRNRLSREVQRQAMEIGINGGIVGDLLTTLGSTIAEDKTLVTEAGYKF